MKFLGARACSRLAQVCVLLVGISSSSAATTPLLEAAPDAGNGLFAAGEPDESSQESDLQLVQVLIDGAEGSPGLAPRLSELRLPPAARSAARPPLPLRLAFDSAASEERLASGSGCAGLARWCLAHATSTQAP